ncbi:hypothetical protein C2S53_011293 [Perilla frutescens var. hirtella]|uniref:SBP-type domain-containing protein n=1 Tax=Perilla frutescens var. hirtella TaxID=608512 RepID=A0AAD4P1X1_PERFH|nr:hypothetical protein C2S53_011293 [Perilla frutescens var. hirtella]
MESLTYNFEERGVPFTEDVELNMDGVVSIRNPVKGWDSKTFSAPINIFEGQGLMRPDFPEMTENLVLHTQCSKDSLCDVNCDYSRCVPSTSTIAMNSSLEFGTRLSSLAIRTDGEKLVVADLKIEKLESPRGLECDSVSVEDPVLSSQGSPVSAKRARMSSLQSQIPFCIVHGCNKDLSSSKEYHKRHKVCDIHSKTAVVVVNGVRQRFCQQCSRFHMLAEFDDGKRSCRKRLAGHNERRRKPQLDTHFDPTLYGTDLSRTSLFFSNYLWSNAPIRHSRHDTEPLKFGSSRPKPLLHLNEMGKQNPSKNCPNSPLSVLELSAISNSSCAPSLLSAQSFRSMDYPLILEQHDNYNLSFNPNSSIFRGIFSSSFGEADQRVLDASGTPSELLQEPSNAPSLTRYQSSEGANTVDLLQLSLHLQRVEHQKQSEL